MLGTDVRTKEVSNRKRQLHHVGSAGSAKTGNLDGSSNWVTGKVSVNRLDMLGLRKISEAILRTLEKRFI